MNRESRRIDYTGSCELAVARRYFAASISDLSATGCSVATECELKLRKGNVIDIVLPIKTPNSFASSLEVEVMWAEGCMVGLKFNFQSVSSKREYIKFLKNIYEQQHN
ncbi:hypothetical protein VCHA53O466_40386 [Vibrio chagasii]|nr:hypothetical protein VCHA53O466_40386 [Vibrio chagasii]